LTQLKDIIVPVRGQVIVTSPIKPIVPHNLSMNDGYEYMIHRGSVTNTLYTKTLT